MAYYNAPPRKGRLAYRPKNVDERVMCSPMEKRWARDHEIVNPFYFARVARATMQECLKRDEYDPITFEHIWQKS